MKPTKLAYRAEHVGSFLRFAALRDARARRKHDIIAAAELNTSDDGDIENVTTRQEDISLKLVSDGAFRTDFGRFAL